MPVSAMIRRAQVSDLSCLAAVERAAAQKFHLHFGGKPSGGDRTLPHEILERSCAASLLWLAVAGDETIGFLCANQLRDSLHIDELSVAYEHQGQGHGRRLMETAIAEASARKSAVTLTTGKQVPWSYPFYGRLGFIEVGLDECPSDLAAILLLDKQHTPKPETRVAMRLSV